MASRAAVAVLLLLALPAMSAGSAAAQPAPSEAELTAKGGKRLGADDFTSRYVGNTLSGKSADGEAFELFVASGSEYRMLYQGKRLTESWKVGKDGEFCSVVDGAEACTREYDLGGTIYSFNIDGTLAGTAQIRAGNPEKL